MMLQGDSVNSAIGLIQSIGILIGTLGGLVAGVAGYLKAKTHDPRITKALETAEDGGKVATLAAQKIAETQKDQTTIAQVLTTLSPEAKKLLEEQQKNMEYWKERASIAQQQVNRLVPMVPKNAQVNNIKDLPRESAKTLAVVNK